MDIAIDADAGQSAHASTRRGLWVRQIAAYAAIVLVVVDTIAYALSGSWGLVLVLSALCFSVGLVGCLLAVVRSLDENPEATKSDSIYG